MVTPLNPAKWGLTEVNGTVSLNPSVGNWSFPLPVALLDQQQPRAMGWRHVGGADRGGESARSARRRDNGIPITGTIRSIRQGDCDKDSRLVRLNETGTAAAPADGRFGRYRAA